MSRILAQNKIIDFLLENKQYTQTSIGQHTAYRASVTLIDGTFLPCVNFFNEKKTILSDLYWITSEIDNYKKHKENKDLENFDYKTLLIHSRYPLVDRNTINPTKIAKIEHCRFALPNHLQKQIIAEAVMGILAFNISFTEDRNLNFISFGSANFLDLPEGYDFKDALELDLNRYKDSDNNVLGYNQARLSGKLDSLVLWGDLVEFNSYLEDLP